MKIVRIRYFLLSLLFAVLLFGLASCDGIFPTQTKINLPSDHNSSFGGYMHKGIRRGESGSDCEQCHGHDLRGQVYNYNGTLVVTQSCYQCHGNIWDEGGGGNGGKKVNK